MMTGLYPTGYGLAVIVGLTEGRCPRWSKKSYTRGPRVRRQHQRAPPDSHRRLRRRHGKTAGSRRIAGARKAERLQVSVPSHCPLLEPVAVALRATLAGMKLEHPA